MFLRTTFTSSIIRIIGLMSRFILVFFLARFFTPVEVAAYGVFSVAVITGVLLVGLEFYQYANRQLVTGDTVQAGRIVKSQLGVYGVAYALFIPAAAAFFYLEGLSYSLYFWLVALVMLEHMNEEMGRILIASSKPITANLLSSSKQIGWSLLAPIVMLFFPALRSLDYLFFIWCVANVCVLIVASNLVSKLGYFPWMHRIDWSWIRWGLWVALPLLLSAVSVRFIFTIDRYWLLSLANVETVAAYVLFVGMASVMTVLVDAVIVPIHSPMLIKAVHQHAMGTYRSLVRRMVVMTGLIIVGIIASSLIVLPWVLRWVNNPVYTHHQTIFYWVLAAYTFYSLSNVFQSALYALKEDRLNSVIGVLAAGGFVLMTYVFSAWSKPNAILYSLAFVFFVLLLVRASAYYYCSHRSFLT